jgi:hypothetical protein
MDMTLVSPSDIWMKSHESLRKNYRTVSVRFGQKVRLSHPFHLK